MFDLLFQETFTGRYALPLVVPIAYLAVAGLRACRGILGLAVAVALAMFCAHVGGTSIAAYSRVAGAGLPACWTRMGTVARLGDGVSAGVWRWIAASRSTSAGR